MSAPIAWPEAQRICDIPEVREALDKFAVDACDENMLAMVSAIMSAGSRPREWTDPVSLGSVNRDYDQGFADGCSESKRLNEHLVVAFAQGRAAGLEEAAKDCKAHADIFAGDERELVRMVRGALLTEADRIRALSTTSSDAGKDDARDAARLDWLNQRGQTFGDPANETPDGMTWTIGGETDDIREAIDDAMARAALSSLEVIGKGEKGCSGDQNSCENNEGYGCFCRASTGEKK